MYRDNGCGNNDMINATVDGTGFGSHATMSAARPAAASVQFSAVSPVGKSIVIQGQGGLSRTETATLTFRVFDTFNKPLAGQPVVFDLVNGADITLNKTSDSTDANGEVITTVNSGKTPTTFRVKASLASGVSTLSDSILVTTGLPVQTAFSLGVAKPNVEGWSYDSAVGSPATTITVLLADQAGNPVPDGTPVAFQSSPGAVGSASMGGCTTTNGGCTVDFRSQNPRVATNPPTTPCNDVAHGGTPDADWPGLAIVCASTTDGSKPLFARIGIFERQPCREPHAGRRHEESQSRWQYLRSGHREGCGRAPVHAAYQRFAPESHAFREYGGDHQPGQRCRHDIADQRAKHLPA
jgi:hypothetical protein